MISVILVNHNYGNFVGKAIESVLNQTYKDFELIIVDGNSTDDSRNIIMQYVKKFPDKITAVFKPTSGQAAAFNLGYKISRGEVIAFLDSDDYFLPNKLEEISKEHEVHCFIGHNRTFHDINTGEYKTTKIQLDDPSIRKELLLKYGYVYTYNIITSCMSMTKSLADKIFPMPETEYVTFADCYVKVLAQYYSEIKFLPLALSYYRIHKKQETKTFENNSKLNEFVENLYKRVFRDINIKLQAENKPLIPELTDENMIAALKLTNPHLNIDSAKQYVIYGVGNNSYKIKKFIELLGGHFIYATDSSINKIGTVWEGLNVIDPKELMTIREKYDMIIIGSSFIDEISEYLNQLGFHYGIDYTSIKSIPND